MGCLNSDTSDFNHWFGNIHLSGPCNLKCYFCVGQHMSALEGQNNLHEWPLKGLDAFIDKCKSFGIKEINITGTNTDPMLYQHLPKLKAYLVEKMGDDVVFGVRTNGQNLLHHLDRWATFDKGSISLHSVNPEVHKRITGTSRIPDLPAILNATPWRDRLKVNIVLCPENAGIDLFDTLDYLVSIGIKRVNLREPYGQAHVGNPLNHMKVKKEVYGNPCYDYRGMEVTYWDVHYTGVESINLYAASGRLSDDYPITRGYDETGTVRDQSFFTIQR